MASLIKSWLFQNKTKKGNTLMEIKYLFLALEEVYFKRHLTDRKRFDVALFMLRGILLRRDFWIMNTWQDQVCEIV